MNTVKIKNLEELKNYFDEIIKKLDFTKSYDLSNFKIKDFKIKFEGEKYKSTIDTNIMSYFLIFQKNILDIYSIKKYGRVKKLSKKEIESLNFYVKVEEGSTVTIILNLIDVLGKLLDGDIKMSTEGIIAFCATTAFLGIGTLGYKFWATSKKNKLEEKRIELQKNNDDNSHKEKIKALENMEKMFDSSIIHNAEMFKQLSKMSDTKIAINNKTVKEEDIFIETDLPKVKEPVWDETLTGLFKILEVTFDYAVDTSFATAQYIKTGEVIEKISLQDSYLSPEKINFIKDAEKKEPIELSIKVNRKGKKVETAYVKLDDIPKYNS